MVVRDGARVSFPWISTNFCGFNFTLMPKREHLGLLISLPRCEQKGRREAQGFKLPADIKNGVRLFITVLIRLLNHT